MDTERKKIAQIGAGVLIVILALIVFILKNGLEEKEMVIMETNEVAVSEQSGDVTHGALADTEVAISDAQIVVDVAGAVVSPGVIKLQEGSRVFEAVEKTGGLCNDADTYYINMAALVHDGEKIYIPKKGEYTNISSESTVPKTNTQVLAGGSISGNYLPGVSEKTDKININTATSEQLQSLTGVGQSIAQRIIDYRQTKGNFKQIEDLKKVSGIGEKTFGKLKDKITI